MRVYHKLRELSRLTLTIEIKTGPPRIRTLRLKVFSDDGSEMVDELALSCTGFEATEVKTLLAALGLPAG